MDGGVVDGLQANIHLARLSVGFELSTHVEHVLGVVVTQYIVHLDELRQALQEAVVVLLLGLAPLYFSEGSPAGQRHVLNL